MSVEALTYADLVRTIREIALDIGPVSCFSVSKQDLYFYKGATDFYFSAQQTPVPLLLTSYPKIYDILNYANSQNVVTNLSVDYVPEAPSTLLSNKVRTAITTPLIIYRDNYFSLAEIEQGIYDYFRRYRCDVVYDIQTFDTETEVGRLYKVQYLKIALWVAYWLVDKKRMNYASIAFLKSKNGEQNIDTEEYVNYTKNITTRLGDTHTIVETPDGAGLGEKDFTALWGDKFGYLSKLQLYIRNRFEVGFADFSLRDNTINSSDFIIDKHWSPYAYVDTLALSEFTKDILSSSNEYPE